MKLMIILFALSLSLFAVDDSFEVLSGTLHKGGKLEVHIDENQSTQVSMFVNIQYELYKKIFVPVSSEHLKGSYTQELPLNFDSEKGYLELAEMGVMNISGATLIHKGFVNYEGHMDSHLIQIRPDNNKLLINVIYHPNVPNTGWIKLDLTVFEIPAIGDYSMEAFRLN